mgnify:FL=1
MDKISLVDLKVFAHHGVFDHEKQDGQTFILCCDCTLSTRIAGKSDALDDALDYGALAHRLTALFQEKTFDLIEAAAEYCATTLLHEFPLIRSLRLTVKKPSAPIGLPVAYPMLTIERGWKPVILALGSNIEPCQAHLDAAVEMMRNHSDMRLLKTAGWIETEPWGYTDQPTFINGAVMVETLLTPHELLAVIHEMEHAEGRERLIHWGPRTLDIDIIYYADLLLDTPDLTIPHALCMQRAFVMDPVNEIAPYWIDPRYGKTVSVLWEGEKKTL